MKVLIWFLCLFVASAITTALAMCGILLGGLPTLLLDGGAFFLAHLFCKKWDERKSNKKQ